jgi:hypothetical protein
VKQKFLGEKQAVLSSEQKQFYDTQLSALKKTYADDLNGALIFLNDPYNKEYFISKIGEKGFNQMYDEVRALNQTPETPDGSVYNIKGISSVIDRLEEIEKQYSYDTVSKTVTDPLTNKTSTQQVPLTLSEKTARDKLKRDAMVNHINATAENLNLTREQANELLLAFGLPDISTFDVETNIPKTSRFTQ